MADPAQRLQENASGTFYVDTQCIDCDLCRNTAPGNFRRQDERGYSYVFKQPESEEERGCVLQALKACPVEAIGSDGSAVSAGLDSAAVRQA